MGFGWVLGKTSAHFPWLCIVIVSSLSQFLIWVAEQIEIHLLCYRLKNGQVRVSGHDKKGIQESNFIFNQDRNGKFAAHKKGMPTIRCVCGCEILVVPDLKAMDRAIRNHVAEHKQMDYGLAFDSLEEFLAEQILIVASETNLPNVN